MIAALTFFALAVGAQGVTLAFKMDAHVLVVALAIAWTVAAVLIAFVAGRLRWGPRSREWVRAMLSEDVLTRIVYEDGSVLALTSDGFFYSPPSRFWPVCVKPEPAPSNRVRFAWKEKDGRWELGVGLRYVWTRKIKTLKKLVWFELADGRLVEVFRATVELKRLYPRGVVIRWTDGYDRACAAVRGRGFDPAGTWAALTPRPGDLVDPKLQELGIRRWAPPLTRPSRVQESGRG
jgi:hypothetical protein